MSDFYRRRRVVIKDATALLTFFLGFVWSGAFAWPFLADQVDQGDMTRGLAYFLAAVLGSALVTGVIGLETGNFLGSLWERYHKHHRGFGAGSASTALAWAGSAAPLRAPSRMVRVSLPTVDPASVYYTQAGVYAASFIPLAERVRPTHYEAPRVRAALAKTINIGAWDGPRLVGVVRVLTDGYTYSAVADILVDPEYQRLGIGRTLMQHALAATPDSKLLIDAGPECVGFFERVGCDRGPTGFRLTGAAPT
jgi:ribosomal protein S18 acetylase RimI-like enzyme